VVVDIREVEQIGHDLADAMCPLDGFSDQIAEI
jgi:hypothetical protein